MSAPIMIPFRNRSAVFWAALLVGFTFGTAARATTFILSDTADLLAGADAVVLGHVQGIRSVEDAGALSTNVQLAVEQTLKGLTGPEITVVEPGGQVGDRRRWIHGAPTFYVGERVLLFLRRNRRGQLETLFLAMGKFRVVRSSRGAEFAVRNLGGARVFSRRHGRLDSGASVTSYALHSFISTMRTMATADVVRSSELQPYRAATGSRWQENFTFSGPPLARWFLPDEGQPIAYRTGEDGDSTLGAGASTEAADAALAAWSSTSCANLNLIDAGTAPPASFAQCDGRSQINFNDPFAEMPNPVNCTGVLGIGGVCIDASAPLDFNGGAFYRITEGDVVVNSGFGDCPFWNRTNLTELLTHEIGHTLGLAHSSEDPNESDPTLRDATMYYAAHFDGRGATLMSDDVAAVCALYPGGRTGSVTLRRFAIIPDSPPAALRDRLVVDGMLTLDNGHFDPQIDTLIIDVLAAGASVFRLAIPPGELIGNVSGTRFRYRHVTETASTSLLLSSMAPGTLRFRIRAEGMDLSGAQAASVVMSLAFGETNVTQPVPPLRSLARGGVYP